MPNPVVKEAAAALYDPALPYHNFQHALAVAEEGSRIVDRCLAEGIGIDAEVVDYACLLHDAGFRDDHLARGFDTKEAYSAHLAAEVLGRCGIDPAIIARVLEAILSTHSDAHCATPEARAVRAADLAGLGAEFTEFKTNALRLKREHEMISGESVSWERWREDACDRILQLLRERVDLTRSDMHASGEPVLTIRARENIRRLLAESVSRT